MVHATANERHRVAGDRRPLLMILHPRRIEEAVDALEALNIDKVWLERFSEDELCQIIPQVIADCDHDPIGIISDDTTPQQWALDAVLDAYQPGAVYTGYCNLDEMGNWDIVNLCVNPLPHAGPPEIGDYSHPTFQTLDEYPQDLFRSYFAGFSLTFMSRALWERFPFRCYPGGFGWGSDYNLSWRLQEAGIAIWAVREGYHQHLKTWASIIDLAEGRELLIGKEPSRVRWDVRGEVGCVSTR